MRKTALALVLASLITGSSMQPALAACGWAIVPSVDVKKNNLLDAVTAIAPDDAWAAGSWAKTPLTGVTTALVEHFDGSRWRRVDTPNLLRRTGISGLSAMASDDVWAVGLTQDDLHTLPVIEHYDGSSWSALGSPFIPGITSLSDVSALAADDVWAVGYSVDLDTGRSSILAEHWNGVEWSVVPTPAPHGTTWFLQSVSAIATDDVWAVGFTRGRNGLGHTLTVHWDGTRWKRVASPAVGTDDSLTGVSGIATDDVWAVGYAINGAAEDQAIAERWDGTAWSVVDLPPPGSNPDLFDVVARSATDVWAVGNFGNVTESIGPYSEHWNGATWEATVMPSHGRFNSATALAAVPGGGLWAVGGWTSPKTNHFTLTEAYC
jgi:hypothetical protein